MNTEATAIGIPTMDATLYGTGFGPIIMTMPDGEVLKGHYRLALGDSITSGYASGFGPRGAAIASGTSVTSALNNAFTLQAVGNRGTTVICNGSAGGIGHGDALCETNRGARYQMMF